MSATELYDALAPYYHLLFADWEESMAKQGDALSRLLPPPRQSGPVLDCACGIGTQSLALAARGYEVEGSDLSESAIARARTEAAKRDLSVLFRLDDFRYLRSAPRDHYGAVLALDNSLPHLDSTAELDAALSTMRDRLRPGGTLLLSLRDYTTSLAQRPTYPPPVRYDKPDGGQRTVMQIWNWLDERRYEFRLIIHERGANHAETHAFTGTYRAVTPEEIAKAVGLAGFRDIALLPPEQTAYYQPIVRASAP